MSEQPFTTDEMLAADARGHMRLVVWFLVGFLLTTFVLMTVRVLVREGVARHEANPMSHLHGHRIVPPGSAEPFTPDQRSAPHDTSD